MALSERNKPYAVILGQIDLGFSRIPSPENILPIIPPYNPEGEEDHSLLIKTIETINQINFPNSIKK